MSADGAAIAEDASARAPAQSDGDAPTLPPPAKVAEPEAPTDVAEPELPTRRPPQSPRAPSRGLAARALLIFAIPAALALGVWGISRGNRAPSEPGAASSVAQSTAVAAATPAGESAEPMPVAPAPAESREAPTEEIAVAEPALAEPAPATPRVQQAGSPRPIAARAPATATPKPGVKPAAQPAPKTAPTSAPVAVDAEFNRSAAQSALAAAAAQAMECRKPGDPAGSAVVVVTFAPSGRVTSALVNGKPFAGTATGGCIAAAMRRAQVPPFSGERTTVSKTVPIR